MEIRSEKIAAREFDQARTPQTSAAMRPRFHRTRRSSQASRGDAVKHREQLQAIRGPQSATPRQSCQRRPEGHCPATRDPQQNSRNRTTNRSAKAGRRRPKRTRAPAGPLAPSSNQTRTGKETNRSRKEVERRQGQNRENAPASNRQNRMRLPPQHSMIFSANRSKSCPLRAIARSGYLKGLRPMANQMPHSFKKPAAMSGTLRAAFLKALQSLHGAPPGRWGGLPQYAVLCTTPNEKGRWKTKPRAAGYRGQATFASPGSATFLTGSGVFSLASPRAGRRRGPEALADTIRTRLTRRGSASVTWNSKPGSA
jgi:hypothetical protein